MKSGDTRFNEIATACFIGLKLDEGIFFKPKEAKREMTNYAKKLGIPPQEFAEFAKIVMEHVYKATIAELDTIEDPKTTA